MMSIALLVALLAADAVAVTPPPSGKPACQNPGVQQVDAKAKAPGIHPLGDEPPAKHVMTVMRTFDGCVRPVVVRENIGTPRRR